MYSKNTIETWTNYYPVTEKCALCQINSLILHYTLTVCFGSTQVHVGLEFDLSTKISL